MNTTLTIQSARKDDMSAISVVLSDWLTADEVRHYQEQIRESVSDTPKFDAHYVVAMMGSDVVGVAGWRQPLPKLLPFTKSPKPAELCMLYVRTKHRGREGIGTALLEHLIKEIRTRGYTELVVRSAEKFRTTGWGFYDKVGFSRAGDLLPPESATVSQIWRLSIDHPILRKRSRILLDGKDYHLVEDGLPCLVTYKEKSGGSHFSVALVADIALRNSKLLFLTAYPMAKDLLLQELYLRVEPVIATKVQDITPHAHVMIVESGNENLFVQALEKLGDISDRVVFVKNIEVFGSDVMDRCLKLQKIILSGDIDQCSAKQRISEKLYKTIVAFSQPQTVLPINVPHLEKYQGYLWNAKKGGLVMLSSS